MFTPKVRTPKNPLILVDCWLTKLKIKKKKPEKREDITVHTIKHTHTLTYSAIYLMPKDNSCC